MAVTVDKRKKGVKVEAGNKDSVGKWGKVPETDGEGCWENSPPHYENTSKHKSPAVNGTSVPPAATKRQQPANQHPLMNGKA